jgi:hypothetical protein
MIQNAIMCLMRRLKWRSSKTPAKNSADPVKVLERIEYISFVAALTAVVGILVETWNAFAFRFPGEQRLDLYSKLVADGLVAAGVTVEAICVVYAIVWTRREKTESHSCPVNS